MALTFTTEPEDVQIARNPVVVELNTDNALAGTPVLPSSTHTFSVGFPHITTLTLSWLAQDQDLSFVAGALDASGRQLTAYTAGSLATWVQQMVVELNNNYLLNRDFDIIYNGLVGGFPQILMTARNYGAQYDMTTSTPPPGYTFVPTAGTTSQLRPNFAVQCDIYAERDDYLSGDWDLVVSMLTEPDINGDITLRLEEILNAQILSGLPEVPPFGGTNPVRSLRHIKRFFVKYSERYGVPVTWQLVYERPIFRAISGGLAHDEWPGVNFWDDWIDADNRWLSKYPRAIQKITQPDEPQVLCGFSRSNITTDIDVEVHAYFTDGTSAIGLQATVGSLSRYDFLFVPAGYTELDVVNIDNTKVVDYYTVRLVDTTNAIVVTEYFTFKVDWELRPHNRTFLFFNSLGAWETITLQGMQEEALEIMREEAAILLAHDYTAADPVYKAYQIQARQDFTLSSGWLTQEECDWYDELLTSEKVYRVTDDGYLPVTITTSKARKKSDEIDMWAVEISYRPAYNKIGANL